jgi:membrane associated rhomboid family serine protease
MINNNHYTVHENPVSFRESFLPPLYFILILWGIHLFQIWTHMDLGYWGIYPREAIGLRGILFAPLLHDDWGHLASNSVPFLVLTTIMIYFYPRVALATFIILYFVTGIAVWVFARTGVFHIGLSYVVYGLVSFVFWTGIFRRSIRSIVLALIVLTLYSGMFMGVLPTEEVVSKNISWESHLLGGVIGILTAYFFKEELEEHEKEIHSPEYAEKQYFFPADIFEKTREERLREADEERQRQEEERRRQQEQKDIPPFSGWISDNTL